MCLPVATEEYQSLAACHVLFVLVLKQMCVFLWFVSGVRLWHLSGKTRLFVQSEGGRLS